MKKIEKLVKEAYEKLKSRKLFSVSKRRISDEDMACYAEGLLNKRDKEKFLENALLHSEESEASKNSFILASDTAGIATEKAPGLLVDKVKQFIPVPLGETVLDAVVEFAGNVARVIRTTGTALTYAAESDMLLASEFRGVGAETGSKAVELSKVVDSHIVDVKIVKIKKDMANLTVHIKNKKSGTLSSGERVSLLYKDRELRSSLTESGKVEFENIKIRDYRVNLVRKGEPYCLAILSLRALEK